MADIETCTQGEHHSTQTLLPRLPTATRIKLPLALMGLEPPAVLGQDGDDRACNKPRQSPEVRAYT
jgi:hypothetical protein